MKITGGFLKGRNILCPASCSKEIRPLRTRVRKALFDILGDDLSGLKVLDLYAGTGALGLEALSRGAEFVVFVDASQKSVELIKKNAAHFNFSERTVILQLTLPQGLKKIKERFQGQRFDLVFITPPYKSGLALKTLESMPLEILHSKSILVVEEESTVNLPAQVFPFELEEKRTYGETSLYFYRLA